MKQDKSTNGHIWNKDGIWYNFCYKCSIKKDYGKAKGCVDFKINPEDKHYMLGTHCNKCNMIPDFKMYAYKVHGSQIVIPYAEEKSDRMTSRFYCGYFSDRMHGVIEITCMYSKEDMLIKEIIE